MESLSASSLRAVFATLAPQLWRSRSRIPSYLAAGAAALTLAYAPATHAQTWTLAAGGTWNATASWNPASIPNAIGANATFNNAASGSNPAQIGNSTVTLDGSQTVGSINFNNDAVNAFTYSITTGTNGPLVFDATGAGPATIVVNSVAGATGNNTISVVMTLTDDLVATVNNVTASSSAGALNLTAAMSGPGGFTKLGDGLATLGTGAKTYTGATVLSGGRTRVSFVARPQNTSSFTVNAGGQLTLIAGGNYTFGSGPLNLNGTGPSGGPQAGFPGALRPDRPLAPVTINNPVVLQSDTLIHIEATGGTGASAAPGATNTFTGTISGPGRLTFTAPNSDVDQGFLVLSGANTYTGGTLVNGGFLVASGASATFGTGNVTVDNSASPNSIARLRIESGVLDAIADTATLSLRGGGTAGVADQGYVELGAGVNEVVGALLLAGMAQAPGTYGSTASPATFQNNEFFAGTGIITVPPLPVLAISSSPPNVVVSWPTNAARFQLQGVGAMGDAWADDNTIKVISGTNYTVTETAPTNKFFRLKR